MSPRIADLLAAGLLFFNGLLSLATLAVFSLMFFGFSGLIAAVGVSEEQLDALIAAGIFGGLGLVLGIVLFIQAAPSLVGAAALLFDKDWGRIVGLVAGLLALPTFPVGTILGGGAAALIAWAWSQRSSRPRAAQP